jgi:aspartyl-tRNA(Asn)/glutamyl-tRNA(Gln) amidotransferase subunit C
MGRQNAPTDEPGANLKSVPGKRIPKGKEVYQLEKTKISKEQVAHVAHLARLEFGAEEMDKFTSQLNDILLYMDKLGEVDTAGVEPVTHAIARKNAFREDEVSESLPLEASLANAPEARAGCFIVPKVID